MEITELYFLKLPIIRSQVETSALWSDEHQAAEYPSLQHYEGICPLVMQVKAKGPSANNIIQPMKIRI